MLFTMFKIEFVKGTSIDAFEGAVAKFEAELEAMHGPVEYVGILHNADGVHFEVVYKKA